MSNWKIKKVNEKLENIAEVQAHDIYMALEKKEISDSDARSILLSAIRLAEMEIDYLSYMVETDQGWNDFAYSHLSYRKNRFNYLVEYADELKMEWSTTSHLSQDEGDVIDSSKTPKTFSRIMWKGNKTDFGRVYDILSPLLDCTAAEWERHFMDSRGGDMTKATDIHKGGTTRSSEINALLVAKKSMESEIN